MSATRLGGGRQRNVRPPRRLEPGAGLALIGENDCFRRGGPDVETHQKCHAQNLREMPSMAAFSLWVHQTPGQQLSFSLERRRLARALSGRYLQKTLGATLIDQDVATGQLLRP